MVRYQTSRSQGRKAGRAAIATVEFALLMPVLASIVVGMFEVGRAIMVKEVLSNAARKGCRTATYATRGSALITNTDVRADIDNVLRDNSIDATRATVTILVTNPDRSTTTDVSQAQPKARISVQVSIPFSAVSWTGQTFVAQGSLTSETLVMRRQP